jgi:hypothetical protein
MLAELQANREGNSAYHGLRVPTGFETIPADGHCFWGVMKLILFFSLQSSEIRVSINEIALGKTSISTPRVRLYVYFYITSELAGGKWLVSRPGRFITGERAPGTHWIGGWVDLRAGLNDVEKRKYLILPGLELRSFGRPARS